MLLINVHIHILPSLNTFRLYICRLHEDMASGPIVAKQQQSSGDVSAAPAPVLEFTTYSEYLSRLRSQHLEVFAPSTSSKPSRNALLADRLSESLDRNVQDGDLWILRFHKGGSSHSSYRYQEGKPRISYNNSNHTDIELREVLPKIIDWFEDSAEYQFLLLELGYEGLPAAWAVDALGLGLDLEPAAW